MVKITNGKDVFEVTRGAFDGIYSKQGYTILDEKEASTPVNVPDSTPEKTEDEKFLESRKQLIGDSPKDQEEN